MKKIFALLLLTVFCFEPAAIAVVNNSNYQLQNQQQLNAQVQTNQKYPHKQNGINSLDMYESETLKYMLCLFNCTR